MDYAYSILIIIPCYNEAQRIDVATFETFISKSDKDDIHFLFVNDGSTDNTLDVLSQLKKRALKVSVLDLEKNGGKAEAIRQGMLSQVNSSFDYIGYFDADLATPLDEIYSLKSWINAENLPFLVMGSRVKLLGSTQINRKRSRHYIGRIFATVVSNMLKLPVYDTQCGAKLIKNDVASIIFKEPFVSKWLFDVELLFRIKNNFPDFNQRIIEVPLKKWDDVAGSKIGFAYFLKAPFDLLKIYFKYN